MTTATTTITSNGAGPTASVSVAENSTAVADVDATAAGTVVYSLSGADAGRFSINSGTGVVVFAPAPNFEAPTDTGADNIYNFTVTANDGSASDTQDFAVTVTNVVETPVITTIGLVNGETGSAATATVAIPENVGSVVDIRSPDGPTYTITGGADAALFKLVVQTSFVIGETRSILSFVNTPPDFEHPGDADHNNSYLVQLTATNAAGTDVQDITVNITNVTTGPPAFIFPFSNALSGFFTIKENTNTVRSVVAVDETGATITYSLGGADAGQFHLDTSAHTITFNTTPDFENPTDADHNNIYLVDLIATSTTGVTTLPLQYTITNVVNETPAITSNGGGATASLSVAENTTAVTTVAATDPSGATLAYTISGGVDAGKFAINGSTGVLTFATAPDFENPTDTGHDNVYDLQVTATSAGGSVVQAIAVTVTDVAEQPVITSNGGGATAAISVAENTTAVTTITSTDPNAAVRTYTISGGVDAGKFAINGASGVLTFATAPDFENPTDTGHNNVYDLQVTATSSGGTDVQAIAVTVTDVDEGGGGPSGPAPTTTPTGGDDSIPGTSGPDSFAGGGGADTVDGGAGNDSIDGNLGNDSVAGGDGGDNLRGLEDNDSLDGGAGNDTVNGNTGNDSVNGGDGTDLVYGGQGNDSVDGGAGADTANGNKGDDIVHGGDGNDSVYGGQGNDTVFGDAGDDRISGDLGNDLLFGGAGADKFIFAPGFGADWIGDFSGAAGDRIVLPTGQHFTLSEFSGQVVIDLGGGSVIALVGVSLANFDTSWITFS